MAVFSLFRDMPDRPVFALFCPGFSDSAKTGSDWGAGVFPLGKTGLFKPVCADSHGASQPPVYPSREMPFFLIRQIMDNRARPVIFSDLP